MVLKKLNEIMKEVGYMKKDMKVDMGGKGSYNAVSERKVLQTVRPLLVEKGLVIVPFETVSFERFGTISMLVMNYRVVDVNDEDMITVSSVGQGASSGDKGANSAMTYAMKNLILKMLLLESGDDPEAVGDVKHEAVTEKNSSLAKKLAEEVGLLSQGGKVDAQTATGMIAYINKMAHDPGVLRDIDSQIQELKSR